MINENISSEAEKADLGKVTLRATYSIKKAEDPQRICQDCAMKIGLFCFNRSACPDDGSGLNLFYEGSEVLSEKK